MAALYHGVPGQITLLSVASPGFGVRGGHDKRGAEGASIEAPKGADWGGYGEGVRSPVD